MIKDAYFFPHDSNAQHDEKILLLRSKFGWAGYGIYWAIIEKLRDSQDYQYSTQALAGLALGLSHAQAELEALLEYCYTIGLFTKNGDYLHSASLTRRMAKIDARRNDLKEFGRRGGLSSSQAKAKLKPPSSTKSNQIKSKQIKNIQVSTGEPVVNQVSTSDNGHFKPPTLEEVSAYCKHKGYSIDPAQFHAHYASNGWMVGKNKMKDWQQSVVGWQVRNKDKQVEDTGRWNPL